MADRIGVQFTIPASGDTPAYTDTLWFDSLTEYQGKTARQIQTLKDERYNNWKTAIATPPDPPAPPAPEDVKAQFVERVREARAALDALDDLSSVVDG